MSLPYNVQGEVSCKSPSPSFCSESNEGPEEEQQDYDPDQMVALEQSSITSPLVFFLEKFAEESHPKGSRTCSPLSMIPSLPLGTITDSDVSSVLPPPLPPSPSISIPSSPVAARASQTSDPPALENFVTYHESSNCGIPEQPPTEDATIASSPSDSATSTTVAAAASLLSDPPVMENGGTCDESIQSDAPKKPPTAAASMERNPPAVKTKRKHIQPTEKELDELPTRRHKEALKNWFRNLNAFVSSCSTRASEIRQGPTDEQLGEQEQNG